MSGRLGKSGLSPGTSWHLFAENIAFEEDENPTSKGSQETLETTRLHKEDMKMFGECPSQDNLSLVICKQCQKILLPSAVLKHYEIRHPKALSSVLSSKKIPKPLVSPTGTSYSKSKLLKASDNNFIRIEEVDPTDINVKIEEVPLTMPSVNTSAKIKLPKVNIKKLTGVGKVKEEKIQDSKSTAQPKIQPKKGAGVKDKEYNPDRHCGVWIADQHRRCTRSLTCKTHSLSLRRLVTGRRRPFDVLLSEHKARVQGGIKEDFSTVNGTAPSGSPLMKNGIASPPPNSSSLTSPALRHQVSNSTGKYQQGDHSFLSTISSHVQQTCHFQTQLVNLMNRDAVGSANLSTVPHHPRPMRVNRFGARSTLGGGVVFHHKLDRFHIATRSLFGMRHSNPLDNRSNGLSTNSLSSFLSCDNQVQLNDDGIWASGGDRVPIHPLPGRLKGKGGQRAPTGIKRQLSLNTSSKGGASSTQSSHPPKRRHSVDTTLPQVASIPPDTFKPIDVAFSPVVKPLSDLGQVVANIENISSPTMTGTPVASSVSTLTVGTLSLSNPIRGDAILTATNLNSSLNLCQTLEMAGVVPPNVNAATVGNVTFATRLPARTFGSAQQQQQPMKAGVKDILPRPLRQQQLVGSSGTNLIQGGAGAALASNGYVYQAIPFNDKGNHILPASHQQLVVTSLPLGASPVGNVKSESSHLNSNSCLNSNNAVSTRASTPVAINQTIVVNANSNPGSNPTIPRSYSPASVSRLKQLSSAQSTDMVTASVMEVANAQHHVVDSSTARSGVASLVVARQPDAPLTPS